MMANIPNTMPLNNLLLTSSLKIITLAIVVNTSRSGFVIAVSLPSPVVDKGIPTKNLDKNIKAKAAKIIGEKRYFMAKLLVLRFTPPTIKRKNPPTIKVPKIHRLFDIFTLNSFSKVIAPNSLVPYLNKILPIVPNETIVATAIQNFKSPKWFIDTPSNVYVKEKAC